MLVMHHTRDSATVLTAVIRTTTAIIHTEIIVVFLFQGYHSIKVSSKPVYQLAKPGPVLASTGALSYQGGIGGKNDAFSNSSIGFSTNFPVLKLNV